MTRTNPRKYGQPVAVRLTGQRLIWIRPDETVLIRPGGRQQAVFARDVRLGEDVGLYRKNRVVWCVCASDNA